MGDVNEVDDTANEEDSAAELSAGDTLWIAALAAIVAGAAMFGLLVAGRSLAPTWTEQAVIVDTEEFTDHTGRHPADKTRVFYETESGDTVTQARDRQAVEIGAEVVVERSRLDDHVVQVRHGEETYGGSAGVELFDLALVIACAILVLGALFAALAVSFKRSLVVLVPLPLTIATIWLVFQWRVG